MGSVWASGGHWEGKDGPESDDASRLLLDGPSVSLEMLDPRSLVMLAASGSDCRRLVRQWARALHLQGNPRAGVALTAMLALVDPANITTLNLEFGQGVSEPALVAFIRQAPRLMRVNVNALKIGDESVIAMGQTCPALHSLSAYWNLRVTDAGLAALAAGCPELAELNLSGCKAVTSAGVRVVAQRCSLTNLDLTRCTALDDGALRAVAEANLKLRSLNLYSLSHLGAAALGVLGCATLLSLDLCGCSKFTDAGLEGVAQRSPRLRRVSCTWCVQLTDVGVVTLAESCHALEYLSLHGILGITDKSIAALAKSVAGSLHTIDITGCVNVQARTSVELRQVLPKLTVFRVHS